MDIVRCSVGDSGLGKHAAYDVSTLALAAVSPPDHRRFVGRDCGQPNADGKIVRHFDRYGTLDVHVDLFRVHLGCRWRCGEGNEHHEQLA
jgi:hypothetical protein